MNVTGETRGRKLCIRRANATTRSLILARYLFRFSSGKEFVPDNVGTELPNLKAAHRHSIELIDKTVRFMSDVPEWRGWRIVITDDRGEPPADRPLPALRDPGPEGLRTA